MKLISYGWLDDTLIGGDVKIECDCGNIIQHDTIDTQFDPDNFIVCNKCGKKARAWIKIVIEDIKEETP